MKHLPTLLAACVLTLASEAQAWRLVEVSPDSEQPLIQQVTLRFDEPMTGFGDPRAPAPLRLSCSDPAAAQGSGRWLDARRWVYDFAADLPPGVRCTARLDPALRSARGGTLSGPDRFDFSSAGPFVKQVWPDSDQAIEEDALFALQLNGPASPDSLRGRVWCQADGLGERIGIRLVDGAERQAVLRSLGAWTRTPRAAANLVTLACQRRFTAGARMRLVYGPGVRSLTAGSGSVAAASGAAQVFEFLVRPAFSAQLSCERESAQADCLPLRPLRLSFSAPVARQWLQGIRLEVGQSSRAPDLDAGGAEDGLLDSVRFKPPFPEQSALTVTLPAGFQDASGRTLENADSFPLKTATGPMPPLVKFAAAPFGVIERLAEPGGVAMLPITLRAVEPDLPIRGLSAGSAPHGGQLSDLRAQSDAEIITWLRRVRQFHDDSVSVEQARAHASLPAPALTGDPPGGRLPTRTLSLLQGRAGVRALDLPRPAAPGPRPFEVVGLALSPGFHVLEAASPRLGASLLDERLGADRTLYVRSSVLVTNLGVHFKLGRENALAWVTTLDRGTPVAHARVRVSDCRGREVASAVSNAQGLAFFTGISPQPPVCSGDEAYTDAYFVSARAQQGGVQDLAFTWSDWHQGIEPWRFNLPTRQQAQPDERAHTVFDRTLFRAGETVSMKHLLRSETSEGFGLSASPPETLVITHAGSGQVYSQPLAWRRTATGGQSAESTFAIPPAAKLGLYEVELRSSGRHLSFYSGQFRVEEFRLPVLQGRITPQQKKPLVHAQAVPVDVQLSFVSGGGASQWPVRVSALVRPKDLNFSDHEDFSFARPGGHETRGGEAEDGDGGGDEARVIADKLPLTLDRNGSGSLTLDAVPAAVQAQELLLEASYFDPNGEMQTLRSTQTLWPAGVVAGIKAQDWVASGQKIRFQALALDLNGQPQADVALEVHASSRVTTTSRKRLVGGFYAYDNQTRIKSLGSVCSGRSDSRGLLLCEASLQESGEVELTVTARDAAGHTAQAAASVYVTQQGELWFGGGNHDRIDLIPEKRAYQPGETARFQVRMPFRQATALVAVEREGILHTEVLQLSGKDPTVSLQVKEGWGPNVYVSVLALRGRLHEVPWYSFFTWGYKAPREWWGRFWHEGRAHAAPTAMVDLSKPAFRFGVAEIRVGAQAHQLAVSVTTDQPSYTVRSQAKVSIQVKLPNGQPAAHAEVALAAVDQALLELMPNTSWDLLEAMLQRRSWGVETATAQMEIVGRRHYGRKAVPAGGGGGRSGTRELLDTLLLWNPKVQLDAQGSATVMAPLNDALTSFEIVAVADASTGLFGSGRTRIRTTQDLQIIHGLPPLVREDDVYRAQISLRNTTAKTMKVQVTPRATLLNLEHQTLDIPGGETREAQWTVKAPAALALSRFKTILWEIEAIDTLGGARDALKASQRILPAVPLSVQQALLVQLDGPLTLPVSPPALAVPGRGGLKMALQPRLADGLPGVKDWLDSYPFVCLEQKTSQALGLRDPQRWQTVTAQLPSYLDADGLANFFPPRDGQNRSGSDILTAYLLAAAHEASRLDPSFALSEALRAPMERGLIGFVEGRVLRRPWGPGAGQAGALDLRKLAAIEALSRYGRATARMLDSITVAPNHWPTHSLIDWFQILKRLPDLPERDKLLVQATQALKARINAQGSTLSLIPERNDEGWWLMHNADTRQARLMLAVMDEPAWQDSLGRLAQGLIQRQVHGAWRTTPANLWGSLALQKFSARFEAAPVSGATHARLGGADGSGAGAASNRSNAASVDWSRLDPTSTAVAPGAVLQSPGSGVAALGNDPRHKQMFLPWGETAAENTLSVTHQGTGKPWLTLQAVSAVALKAPLFSGYQITKTITPVTQSNPSLPAGSYTRGDVLRITLEVTARADMSWVAITDPIPAGATLLGSGLGRDSELAIQGERREGEGWLAFVERSFESMRSYYEVLPKGTVQMAYTIRLNNVGDFSLPPSRVEAMYAPEVFGEAPNARIKVEADQ